MREKYEQQKLDGVLSGACSSSAFPEGMTFEDWLEFQRQERDYAESYDV